MSPKRITSNTVAAAALCSAILVVSHAHGQSPCPEWSLATDFRVSPDQENPNRDSCGNADVWHFLESDADTFPAHDPSTYSLLPEFIDDVFHIQGLEGWQGTFVHLDEKSKLPWVHINNTGCTQEIRDTVVWPADVVAVHPLPDEFVVVGWESPITGAVTVTGGVTDLDNSCGNGVSWSIDHFDGITNSTLALGSIPEGGAQDFQDGAGGDDLAHVPMDEGDFLYFLVDPNSMNFECDSTGLSVVIQPRGCDLELALEQRVLHAGEELRVGISLSHHRPITVTVPFLLWVDDAKGTEVARFSSPPITLEPGDQIERTLSLTLPAALPPGDYWAFVGVEKMQQRIAEASRRFAIVE